MMIRDFLFLLCFALLVGGCANGSLTGPKDALEVGPVAAAMDGSEDADPLAAEIDLSNDAAEEADYDPLEPAEAGAALE